MQSEEHNTEAISPYSLSIARDHACAECGPLVRNMRFFYMCRAKTDGGTKTCGQYMPGKLWAKPKEEKWRFYCRAAWDQVVDTCPRTRLRMENSWGKNRSTWPTRGCGARFVPYSRGECGVVEFKDDEGWHAFMSVMIPAILEDEIMKHRQKFAAKAKCVTEQEIKDLMPVTYPVTYAENEQMYPGVARFPVDRWIEDKEPTMSEAGWIALCRAIAMKDPEGLSTIFDAADKVEQRATRKRPASDAANPKQKPARTA